MLEYPSNLDDIDVTWPDIDKIDETETLITSQDELTHELGGQLEEIQNAPQELPRYNLRKKQPKNYKNLTK